MVKRMTKVTVLALGVGLLGAGATRAAGAPVLGIAGASGVLSGEQGIRYVARPGRHETVVGEVGADGVLRRRTVLAGRYGVPMVAYDGSAGGLAQDGSRLVLIRPRGAYIQQSTSLVILAARTLHVLRRERLRGDFSVDAVSPDGTWIYLIEYTSNLDPTRYRVRALNASTGRLVRGDIVDPRNRGEAMRGNPLSRVTSPDGRWAYTLYSGGSGRPFVHALDTARLTARCIDVRWFPANVDPFMMRLRMIGGRLAVRYSAWTLSEIDVRTLSLVRDGRGRSGAALPAAGRGHLPSLWIEVLVVAAAILVGAIFLVRRRRVPLADGAV